MYSVLIGSCVPSLLDRAIAALVRELRPDWSIEISQVAASGRASGLIRLTVGEPGRWMAILLSRDDNEGAADALANGASAVISTCSEAKQLDLALRAVVDGGAPFITAELARGLALDLLAKAPSAPKAAATSIPRLTVRETQVLELVAVGLSNGEIAERLTLSINTVRTHLQTISTKLQATSRTRMVASAWSSGIHLGSADISEPVAS